MRIHLLIAPSLNCVDEFRDLPVEKLKALSFVINYCKVPGGHTIWREGEVFDPAQFLPLIRRGEVKAVVSLPLKKIRQKQKEEQTGNTTDTCMHRLPAGVAKKLEAMDNVEIELVRKGCNNYFLEKPALLAALVSQYKPAPNRVSNF